MNKRKVKYTEAPRNISREITEGEIVTDFLPFPEKLIKKGCPFGQPFYPPFRDTCC
jgi:hypothetical protein